jgi:hypothetical protein
MSQNKDTSDYVRLPISTLIYVNLMSAHGITVAEVQSRNIGAMPFTAPCLFTLDVDQYHVA